MGLFWGGASTYTGTVDIVVNPTKGFCGFLHHLLHAGFISDIDFQRYRLEVGARCKFLALLGSVVGTLEIDICEGDALGSGFSKGESCFFA